MPLSYTLKTNWCDFIPHKRVIQPSPRAVDDCPMVSSSAEPDVVSSIRREKTQAASILYLLLAPRGPRKNDVIPSFHSGQALSVAKDLDSSVAPLPQNDIPKKGESTCYLAGIHRKRHYSTYGLIDFRLPKAPRLYLVPRVDWGTIHVDCTLRAICA